ncbi:ABC transporter permease [uncultured Pseudokineococcus sp.]|uniref:ABC transporter permease n=1 Tax=uncultured Pseudokineococcus sp. TaxID=1642928 RepID=UPI00262BE9F7|nr:ABC transporter permease [uncultured Pseudokineococcus sp.]
MTAGTAPLALPETEAPTPRRRGRPSAQLVVAVVLLSALTAVAVAPGAFAGADPEDCDLSRSVQAPSWAHPFGFDVFGCDYAAQVVHGTRASLVLAVVVVLGTGLIALVVGTVAGFAGGPLDAVLSRLTDVWSGIPLILGGIVLLSASDARGLPQVALVLVAFSWPPMVRVMRASVQQTRERDHVAAARALGAGPWHLVTRHVVPNAVRPLVVFASAYAGVVIAAEAILTFAGVGLARPTQSWGILLLQAQDRLAQAPHLLVFPGLFLVAAVLGFVLLGEGLRRSPHG